MNNYKHNLDFAIEMEMDRNANPEESAALEYLAAEELRVKPPSIHQQIHDALNRYRAAGLSVFPVDKNKVPLFPWKNGPRNLQIEQPTEQDIKEWAELKLEAFEGVAIICGFNRTIGLDFDDPAYYRKWLAEVSATERIDDLAIEQSPRDGGGFHVGYRLSDDVKIPHTTVLAKREDAKNAIELKANSAQDVGGAVIIATPSLHHSGRQYHMIQGDWTKLPTVDQKRHDRFIEAARALDARRKQPVEATPDILTEPVTNGSVGITPIIAAVAEGVKPTSPVATSSAACKDELLRFATNYTKKCQPAVAGQNGNNQTFNVAGHLAAIRCERGHKLSERAIVGIIEDHLQCNPPWADNELATIVHSAMSNGTKRHKDPIPCKDDNETVSATYTGPVAPQQSFEIDVNRFPLPIRAFVSDLTTRNDMIAAICHFGAAYATLGHLIGKVMTANEKGAPYYPNLWVVCLAETGGGKTGAITPIESEIREMGTLMSGGTMAAMFDVVGNTITKRDWQSLSDEQRTEKQKEFNRNARLKLTGNYLITDECTGLLNSLMGGWDSKNPAKDIEALLKLADSASYIPKHLSGEGYKIIADSCVSFLGYTQNETWQNKFGGDQFKGCGLFGRFIPLTGRGMRLEGLIPCQGHTYKSVMEEVHEAARLARQQIDCSFLNPDGSDFIKDAKHRMTDWGWVKKMQDVYPRDWANLQNKIVIHAIKCSMIDAFLNRDYLDGLSIKSCIDASVYFERHMKWISAAYWFYLEQSEAVSTTAKHEQVVVSLLKKYQSGMTKRDIARRLNIFGSELVEILEALKSDGQVSVHERINRNGIRTAVYTINGRKLAILQKDSRQ